MDSFDSDVRGAVVILSVIILAAVCLGVWVARYC